MFVVVQKCFQSVIACQRSNSFVLIIGQYPLRFAEISSQYLFFGYSDFPHWCYIVICIVMQEKCSFYHPPGNEIYRKETISFFEIDGRKNKVCLRQLHYFIRECCHKGNSMKMSTLV